MKEIIKKLAEAKKMVKSFKMKKDGRNDYSEYDYFTPNQVELIVSNVCAKCNLLTKFDLLREPLGEFGRLTIFDVESCESLEFTMATAIPQIKATNVAQQLGGCATYTERYLKMTAFGIVDNNLDFDTQNTNKNEADKVTPINNIGDKKEAEPQQKKPDNKSKKKFSTDGFISAMTSLNKPFPQKIGKNTFKSKEELAKFIFSNYELTKEQLGALKLNMKL